MSNKSAALEGATLSVTLPTLVRPFPAPKMSAAQIPATEIPAAGAPAFVAA